MNGLLDANISIYATGAESEFRVPCADILRLSRQHVGLLITSAEMLQEVYNVLLRRGLADRARRTVELLDAAVHGHVEPVTRADVLSAISESLPAGLGGRDRVQVALMRRLGITNIISADKHFDEVPGIRRLDPLDLAQWRDSVFGLRR